ncbi:MAG: GNAT family N-acetyltransferase [Candidatus Hodarchaeota archaeon]
MYEVRELEYSQKSYKKILAKLRESLIKYFVETITEELKEAEGLFNRIKGIIESKTDDYPYENCECYEIRSDDEVIGFMTTSLLDKKLFLIRHIFILDVNNKEEVAYILLKEAIERLKHKYKINKFNNAAFTFPEDLLSNPLRRLGFNFLKRHDMGFRLNTLEKRYNLPSKYSFTYFNEEILLKVAELSVQVFKNHPDARFWEEINSVSHYLEFLENSLKTYFLKECSFIVIDEQGQIAGYCLVEKGDDEDEIYIQNIAVQKKYQGKGIGKGLLSKVLEVARKLGYNKVILTVTEGIPAQKMYEKFGFRKYTSFYIITDT